MLGFEHGDPSISNLMVDPSTRQGILNDWDLSYMRTSTPDEHVGGERTGTIPFMALDLLCDAYWDGKIPRLYRHDLEGLIWTLPWVFLQYDDKKLKDPKLQRWRTGSYDVCRDAKLGFLRDMGDGVPMESWKAEWDLAFELLVWLRREDNERVDIRQSKSKSKSVREPSAKEAYRKFCDVVNAQEAYIL